MNEGGNEGCGRARERGASRARPAPRRGRGGVPGVFHALSCLPLQSPPFSVRPSTTPSPSWRGRERDLHARVLNGFPIANEITMTSVHPRRWTVAAAALALIGAPQLRGYCLTACIAAVGPVAAQEELASPSAPCHHSGKPPSGTSSNPVVPRHGGCCGDTRIVQGALPSLAESAHDPQVSAVAPYPAATGVELSRDVAHWQFASDVRALSRSLAVLRI